MKEEHGVTLLESDINEIKLICAEEGRSEQDECTHPRSKRSYIGMGMLKCGVCGKEFT